MGRRLEMEGGFPGLWIVCMEACFHLGGNLCGKPDVVIECEEYRLFVHGEIFKFCT